MADARNFTGVVAARFGWLCRVYCTWASAHARPPQATPGRDAKDSVAYGGPPRLRTLLVEAEITGCGQSGVTRMPGIESGLCPRRRFRSPHRRSTERAR